MLNNLVAWAFATQRIYLKSDGSPWRPIVHIEDIARAYVAAAEARRYTYQVFVDDEALGITGTSYGGIMAMSAVAFAPGEFQAAVAQSGYADWVAFMEGDNELRHQKLHQVLYGTGGGCQHFVAVAGEEYCPRDVRRAN